MYRIQAIILDKKKIREKQMHITLFSREYGKISVWYYKKHFSGDIGDIISCIVERKTTINTVKSYQIKNHLIRKKWTYAPLLQFLCIVKSIDQAFADYDTAEYIYDDYTTALKATPEQISYDQSLLLQMRILKYTGLLDPNFFSNDPVLEYMYKQITKTPLERILKTKPLKKTWQSTIEKSNLYTLSEFASF
ncbi:hypothetical protein CSB09_03575 [Candidatus Gracilibacteria bacterium]|nr:MAG: hypothetical protein CSB09_03575 [Candidatus Gracilibacteria bacterium]